MHRVGLAGRVARPVGDGAASAPRRSAPPRRPSTGLWEQVDDDGTVGGWFHIYERDGVFEGKIVKMFPKPGEKPNPICTKCPGDQKNQPSLGLTLIKGMQRKGRNYENGTILDPRDGSVYQARMELSPDGQKLMVRGFLGIDLFGQSQIWRRLPDSAMAEIITGAARCRAAHARRDGAPAPRKRPQPAPPSATIGFRPPAAVLLLRAALVRRVERRVLLAAQRLAGEPDQVVGDEAHAHHGVDLAVLEGVLGRAPEMPAVVRLDADLAAAAATPAPRPCAGWRRSACRGRTG